MSVRQSGSADRMPAGERVEVETMLLEGATSDADGDDWDGNDTQNATFSETMPFDAHVFGQKAQITSKAEASDDRLELVYQIGQTVGADNGFPAGAVVPATTFPNFEDLISNIWFSGALSVRFDEVDDTAGAVSAGSPADESGIVADFLPYPYGFYVEEGEDITGVWNAGGTNKRIEVFQLLYYARL